MFAQAKQRVALGLVLGILGSAGVESFLTWPFVAAQGGAVEPKPQEDIRPRVRALLHEALQALLDEKAPRPDAQALGECAVLQAQVGDIDAARQTLRRAREAVQALPPTAQYPQWRQLAVKHGEAGEVKELRAILDALPAPGPNFGGTLEMARGTVVWESAHALAKTGRGKEALELAKDITYHKPEATRLSLLREIALYHARAGDLKEAQRTVDSIPDADVKVRALAGLNYRNTPSMDLPGESGIAVIQNEAGDRDGARRTVKQALEIAGAIKDPDKQAYARAVLACAQARVGDLPGALQTLAQVPAESDYHADALMAIARAQAAAGQGKEALQTVEKLKTPSLQVRGLSQVIIGQAEAGDLKAARASGEKALALAKTLPEQQRGTALSTLVSARARAKDVPGALETAAQIPFGGSIPYSNIVYFQAKAGDTKGALRTVKDHLSQSSFWKSRSLKGIARTQTERGEEKEALAWARELTAPAERGYALLGVASGLLQRSKTAAPPP